MRNGLSDTLNRKRRLLAAAAMLPLALSLASCADDSSSSGATGSGDETTAAVEHPAGTFEDKKATGDTIKVGVINPDGGPNISQPEAKVAAQAAIDYANDHLGGIAGHKIEMDYCASKEDAPSATACANQMVQDGVVGVAVLNTGNGATMAPIITGAGIAYTGYNGASPEELTSENSFIWTAALPGVVAGMAKYSAGASAKNVTIFATDNAAVVGAVQQLADPIFQAAGITVKVAPIPLGQPDVTSNVTAGLGDKPEAIAIVGDATMCTSTLKALGTVAYSGKKMLITPCLDPAAVQAVGDAGLDGSELISGTEGGSDDPEAQLYRAIMAEYAGKDAVTTGAAQTGYQSMMAFIYAAAGAQGDVTAESVIAAFKATKDVSLPLSYGGKMTCDGQQFPGLSALCSNTVVGATLKGSTPTDFTLL